MCFISASASTSGSDAAAGDRRAVHWYRIALAATVAIFFVQAMRLWNFSIDDAGISYRYAANFAAGDGLVWNTVGPHVEGYSNFLWVVILAGGKWLGLDIETFSKVLGVVLGAASIVLLGGICRRLWFPKAFWWLPVLLVAITPEWVAWSVSGLEIALAGTLILVMVLGLCGAPGRRLLLSVGAAGLTTIRPEGAVLAGALLVIGWLGLRGRLDKNTRRDFGFSLAVLAAAGVGLVVFRLLYFGFPFPNTVYAKFHGQLPSLPQVLRWGLFILPLLAASAFGLYLGKDRHRSHVAQGAFALVLLQMIIVLPVHPVMYILHRYQIALFPLVLLSMPVTLDWVSRRKRWLGLCAALALTLWSMQGWPSVWEYHQKNLLMRREQKRLAEMLQSLPKQPTIAMIDAGRVPYWTGLPAYDVGGLCDRRVTHEGFAPEAAIERRAEVYVLSIRPMADGRFFPYLTEDQDVWVNPRFREMYSLWRICPREPAAAAANWMYDYAVFLRTDWALENGFIKQLDSGASRP